MTPRPLHLALAALLALAVACAPRSHAPSAGTPVDPNRPVAIDTYIAAVKAYDQGDKSRAVQALHDAIAANPKLTMARNLLARIYRDDNDYPQATDQYEALVRMDPYWFDNHYNLALCYQMVNRLADSARVYLDALRLKPADPGANSNLAIVYVSLNELDKALAFAKRATEYAPKSAAAFANLAVVLDARTEYAEAQKAYLKSLELDSNQAATLLNYGANLLVQNQPAAAIAVFQRALQLQDSALGHKRLGDAHFAANHPDEALRQYNLALKITPRYYPAMNQMGLVLINQYKSGLELDEEKKAGAVAIWRRSLEIQADQPRVQQWIDQWTGKELFGK